MAEGYDDVVTNNRRFTVEKRGDPAGEVAWRFITHDDQIDTLGAERQTVKFDASQTYFWQATWRGNRFRLLIQRGGVGGQTIYDMSKPFAGSCLRSQPAHRLSRYASRTKRRVWCVSRQRDLPPDLDFGASASGVREQISAATSEEIGKRPAPAKGPAFFYADIRSAADCPRTVAAGRRSTRCGRSCRESTPTPRRSGRSVCR